MFYLGGNVGEFLCFFERSQVVFILPRDCLFLSLNVSRCIMYFSFCFCFVGTGGIKGKGRGVLLSLSFLFFFKFYLASSVFHSIGWLSACFNFAYARLLFWIMTSSSYFLVVDEMVLGLSLV